MMDDKTYENKTVRLTELVEPDGILEGFTLVGCVLDGPAVLMPDETCRMSGNTMTVSYEMAVWRIPPDKPRVLGAVGARNCVIKNCRFRNIGLATNVPEEQDSHPRD
jgi:hypothetical protein